MAGVPDLWILVCGAGLGEHALILEQLFETDVTTQHIYWMFDTTLIQQGYAANLQWSCSHISDLKSANQAHWTVVGEFTRASISRPARLMLRTSR